MLTAKLKTVCSIKHMLNRVSDSLQHICNSKKHQKAVLKFLRNYWQLKTSCDCTAEILVTQEHFVRNVWKTTKPKKERKSLLSVKILLFCKKAKAIMEITLLTTEIQSPPSNYFWKFLVIAVIDRL